MFFIFAYSNTQVALLRFSFTVQAKKKPDEKGIHFLFIDLKFYYYEVSYR